MSVTEESRCSFCGRKLLPFGAPESRAWRMVGDRPVCSDACEGKLLARDAVMAGPAEQPVDELADLRAVVEAFDALEDMHHELRREATARLSVDLLDAARALLAARGGS